MEILLDQKDRNSLLHAVPNHYVDRIQIKDMKIL